MYSCYAMMCFRLKLLNPFPHMALITSSFFLWWLFLYILWYKLNRAQIVHLWKLTALLVKDINSKYLVRLQVCYRHSGVKIVLTRRLDTPDSVRWSICHNHCSHLQVVGASSDLIKSLWGWGHLIQILVKYIPQKEYFFYQKFAKKIVLILL